MLVLAIILLAGSLLLFGIGLAVYKGNTHLIHDYHQQNVSEQDRPAYGRAFAKGLFIFAAALLIGGLLPLFCKAEWVLPAVLWVMAVGLIVFVTVICIVQKKYNR